MPPLTTAVHAEAFLRAKTAMKLSSMRQSSFSR
jgi:hypothetical protein